MENPEITLIQYLKGRGFDAYAAVPSKRPERFLTVERTGGSRDGLFDRATIAVQAWAADRAKASALAYDAVEIIDSMAEALPNVAKARAANVYSFPDPDSNLARYQITVETIMC